MGTIVWDNYFSSPVGITYPMFNYSYSYKLLSIKNLPHFLQNREGFEVPKEAKWPSVAHMLNTEFRNRVGSGLSDENMQFLASKLLGRVD